MWRAIILAVLLLGSAAQAANEEIYACLIIPDTQTTRASVDPTPISDRVDWALAMKAAYDADPSAFYTNFDIADFSDANWATRTGAYGIPIRCWMHVGDVAESGGDFPGNDLANATRELVRDQLKRLVDAGICGGVTWGNHDTIPNSGTGLELKSYCPWNDTLGAEAFYGGTNAKHYLISTNPKFVAPQWVDGVGGTLKFWECAADGDDDYRNALSYVQCPVGTLGSIGIFVAGWSPTPVTEAARNELYDYIRAQTGNSGIPNFVLGHKINNCFLTAGRCGVTGAWTNDFLASATQIAGTVSGHYFGQSDSTDPIVGGCECTGAAYTNDKGWAVTEHGFNMQDWESPPSSKAPISLLIIDECFGDGAGKMYVRNLNVKGGVGSEDWFEDFDSSLEVTPIDFAARRARACLAP